jgi:predicted hotdog family 3-hydroxylacyl-ACP dehydratase
LITETHIRPDSAYFDRQLNGVPNYVGIEYMAQSIAALAGVEARLDHEGIRVGFLLGTRKLQMP